MAEHTKIEWADATVNAVNGCSLASPGCTNCYAMKLAGTRMKHHPSRAGLTQPSKAGPVWTGEVRLSESQLLAPLRWKAPRRIFWNAHGDLFHENVPDEWIDRVFAVASLTPQHTHMILTKRSARMREYFSTHISSASGDGSFNRRWMVTAAARSIGATLRQCRDVKLSEWPLPNVWLGVSVEDQTRADERIPDLLATPAAVRFISAEPLLGPVDLTYLDYDSGTTIIDALAGRHGVMVPLGGENAKLDWVICGGESGKHARPMHPDWARSLRDQCAAAGVAFHFKQWGEWGPIGPIYCDDDAVEHDQVCDAAAADDGRSEIIAPNGGRWPDCQPPDGSWVLRRVGKKAAGRLLDGVEHNGLPA
jgi:protein gp37